VAKKKKGARPGASKKAKKRAAPRRKAAARPKARAVGVHRGLAEPSKVDFKFLKKDIDDHLERLKGMDQTDTRVTDAMAALEGARTALKSPCAPTMVIP
jgi:hypothetical protein